MCIFKDVLHTKKLRQLSNSTQFDIFIYFAITRNAIQCVCILHTDINPLQMSPCIVKYNCMNKKVYLWKMKLILSHLNVRSLRHKLLLLSQNIKLRANN